MSRTVIPLLLLCASPSLAAYGTVDVVPAATLLLPYFEVALDDPNAANTTFVVQNTSASAYLANVTLWTDKGVPTRQFNAYLTGYDLATFDLRLLFSLGALERTATDGQDPSDTISPQGPSSQDINFSSCFGRLPRAPLTADRIASLQAAHTGVAVASMEGRCAAHPYGDRIARGYITIDVVNQCGLVVPTDPGYSTVLVPNGEYANALTGHYTIFERTDGVAFADNLVHIEARLEGNAWIPGDPSFYGGLSGYVEDDARETLPSRWQARFLAEAGQGSLSGGDSSVVVWRDPGEPVLPFTCGQAPAGFDQKGAFVFDDHEGATTLTGTLFPHATQRVRVGELPGVVLSQGYLDLDLSRSDGDSGGPPGAPSARQAFVAAFHKGTRAGFGLARGAYPLTRTDLP